MPRTEPTEDATLEWFVSEEFDTGGQWLVHRGGPNRPSKLFFGGNLRRARDAAATLNAFYAHPEDKKRGVSDAPN